MDNSLTNFPIIDWVAQPNGVARVPVSDGKNNIILHTYDRFTKEYVVFSYCANTGSLNWSTILPAGGYASPCIGNGVVFLPCGYTQFCGIDAKTGEKLWIKELKARNRSTPFFYDNLAYVGVGNCIFGFSIQGKEIKKIKVEGTMFFGNPYVNEEFIYCMGVENPTKNKSILVVYEINKKTDQVENRFEVGHNTMTSCDSSGIEFDEKRKVLFVGNDQGELISIDIQSKKINWKAKGYGRMARSKAFAYKDKVYIGSTSGNIMGVNAITGEVIFNVHLDAEGIKCPPIVFEEKLWVHAGLYLYLMDKNSGEVEQRFAIGHSPYTGFEISNGKLYIAAGDPPDWFYLYSIRLGNIPRIQVKDVNVNLTSLQGDKDYIAIEFEVATADSIEPELLTVDLSMIGGSNTFTPKIIRSKKYKLECHIPKFNRFGSYSLLITAKVGNGFFKTTLPVDLRDNSFSEIPNKYELEGYTLIQQQNEYYSGAAVMESVMNYYGKSVTQYEINDKGEYFDDLGIHSHHKWRTGSVRILHASGDIRNTDMKQLQDKVRFIEDIKR